MGLKNKKVLLGVTGGISAYKALELTRLLIKAGAEVRPVMTRAATEFITPLSLSTLARSKVHTGMFDVNEEFDIDHISLAQQCDIIVVAPATANIIAKAAAGIADDLLSTVIAAATVPVLFAPAMNSAMWFNPILQSNVAKLSELGFSFVEPGRGELACGYEGKGKLADVNTVFEGIEEVLGKEGQVPKELTSKDLSGETVLVTAGPTQEAIDPVRYVSNRSSGRMGFAIAEEAGRRGAKVILVSGPTHLRPPDGVTFIAVTTAEEMYGVCHEQFSGSTLVIMAAAVADYRPKESSPIKIKKSAPSLAMEMERTKDVLKSLCERREGQFLVGFALETENLVENARKKLVEKGLDMVVANAPGAIDGEQSTVTILDLADGVEQLEPMSKQRVAGKIFDRLIALKGARGLTKPLRP